MGRFWNPGHRQDENLTHLTQKKLAGIQFWSSLPFLLLPPCVLLSPLQGYPWCQIQGRGLGWQVLFLDQTEAERPEKNFCETSPRTLSEGLDPPLPQVL